MKPLAIIPTYLTEAKDAALLADCVESMRATTGDALDVLVVDDCSPAPELLDGFERDYSHLEFEVVRKRENTGFSKTVNVGLLRARYEGRDALLVNADIEFDQGGWLEAMLQQENLHGDGLASVVGALLLYPNGIIQHAGIYFSLLTRSFDHLHKYGPHNLPAALVPRSLPVTGALQLIRYDCLMDVGVYDDSFSMGFEDVDYGLRVFLAGRECVYTPDAVAIHHESIFRGKPGAKLDRWHAESFQRIGSKYAETNFATLVPFL